MVWSGVVWAGLVLRSGLILIQKKVRKWLVVLVVMMGDLSHPSDSCDSIRSPSSSVSLKMCPSRISLLSVCTDDALSVFEVSGVGNSPPKVTQLTARIITTSLPLAHAGMKRQEHWWDLTGRGRGMCGNAATREHLKLHGRLGCFATPSLLQRGGGMADGNGGAGRDVPLPFSPALPLLSANESVFR